MSRVEGRIKVNHAKGPANLGTYLLARIYTFIFNSVACTRFVFVSDKSGLPSNLRKLKLINL